MMLMLMPTAMLPGKKQHASATRSVTEPETHIANDRAKKTNPEF